MQVSAIPPVSNALLTAVSGLNRAEISATKAATAISKGINDDTASNIIALDQAANSFAANAKVVDVANRTIGRLLDIFV